MRESGVDKKGLKMFKRTLVIQMKKSTQYVEKKQDDGSGQRITGSCVIVHYLFYLLYFFNVFSCI